MLDPHPSAVGIGMRQANHLILCQRRLDGVMALIRLPAPSTTARQMNWLLPGATLGECGSDAPETFLPVAFCLPERPSYQALDAGEAL